MQIGQVIPLEREIELNAGKKSIQLKVKHVGDRPVQVGSHFHFFEVNRMLSLIAQQHLAIVWTFHPATLSDLSQVKRKLLLLLSSAATRAPSVSTA